jgi:hypothetical protein
MQRTKTLISKNLQNYKRGWIVIYFVIFPILVLFILILADVEKLIEKYNQPFYYAFTLPMIFAYTYSFYSNFKELKKVLYVEYDDANLYVSHNDYQIQIPFEEVKELNIVTGGYLFRLYKRTQVGNEILCLPSIWYPLNYKKVDNEINRVRALIAKRKNEIIISNDTSSNNLSSLNL